MEATISHIEWEPPLTTTQHLREVLTSVAPQIRDTASKPRHSLQQLHKLSTMSKRKVYSVQEKLDVIDAMKTGVKTQAQISRDTGVHEPTLRGWLKNEEKLQRFVLTCDEQAGMKRKKLRTAQDPTLDKALYTWFVQNVQDGAPVSGPLLQAKAEKIHETLHGSSSTPFLASKGWLHKFKRCHGIHQTKLTGEVRSADHEAAAAFPPQLRDYLKENAIPDEAVYNTDETALYYRPLPDRTLTNSQLPSGEGFKQRKNRVTILLTTNKTGSHKLKPLVIGRFQNPRCLHHINRQKMPVLYDHSRNAWMTSAIFQQWFLQSFVPEVRRHLRKQDLDTSAVLLLDNCSAHPPAEVLTSNDGKIKALFLPKNTTSKIQPLDQGIIQNVKMNYRKALMNRILEESCTIPESLRKSTWRRHSTCWARPGAKWSHLPSTTVGPTPSKKNSTKKSRKMKRKLMTTSLGLAPPKWKKLNAAEVTTWGCRSSLPVPWLTGHWLIWRSPSPSLSALMTSSKRINTQQKSTKISQSLPLPLSLKLRTSSPSSPVPAKPFGTYNKLFYTWRPTLKLMTWSWPSWDPSSPKPNVVPAPSSPSSRTSSWRQPSGTDGLLRYSDRDTQLCDIRHSDIE